MSSQSSRSEGQPAGVALEQSGKVDMGAALAEIDRLSLQVADLIAQIATTATHEAQQAGAVAKQIQHGFLVTEQASEGTRATVQQLRELAQLADELRLSVTRFTIA